MEINVSANEATPDGAQIKSISIPGEGEYAVIACSPSGGWLVGCQRAGRGFKGALFPECEYVIYSTEDERIHHRGRADGMTRIHIANNGVFSVADAKDLSGKEGTFSIKSPKSPEALVEHALDGAPMISGLSDNGKYAICHVVRIEDGYGEGSLMAIDVETGETLFNVPCGNTMIGTCAVDERTGEFLVSYGEIGTFSYSREGELQDKKGFMRASLGSDDIVHILYAVEALLAEEGQLGFPLDILLPAVIRARRMIREHGVKQYARFDETALQLQNNLLQRMGLDEKVLAFYERQ